MRSCTATSTRVRRLYGGLDDVDAPSPRFRTRPTWSGSVAWVRAARDPLAGAGRKESPSRVDSSTAMPTLCGPAGSDLVEVNSATGRRCGWTIRHVLRRYNTSSTSPPHGRRCFGAVPSASRRAAVRRRGVRPESTTRGAVVSVRSMTAILYFRSSISAEQLARAVVSSPMRYIACAPGRSVTRARELDAMRRRRLQRGPMVGVANATSTGRST